MLCESLSIDRSASIGVTISMHRWHLMATLRLMGIALLVSKGVVERLAGVDVQRDLIVKSV